VRVYCTRHAQLLAMVRGRLRAGLLALTGDRVGLSMRC
jgi:translation initiation factor IF-1